MVWELLRALGDHARLHLRADGDVTGWSIVNTMLETCPGAQPWRMPPDCRVYEEELLSSLTHDLRAIDPVGRRQS